MNTICFDGYIGGDPEMRETKIKKLPCCVFSVAEQRPKDQDGEEVTQWYRCKAFNQDAEYIYKHFTKGKPIKIVGDLSVRTYQRDDKTTGVSLDVIVKQFDYIRYGSKPARREDDPAEPTPPTPRQAAAADEAAVPDITDPFADQ